MSLLHIDVEWNTCLPVVSDLTIEKEVYKPDKNRCFTVT